MRGNGNNIYARCSVHMGLDNHLSVYSKRVKLTDAIVEQLRQHTIDLCGFDGRSFRGKAYAVVIDIICNESLYSTLCPSTLGNMARTIEAFLGMIKTDSACIDVRDYFTDYDDSNAEDRYYITKDELASLKTLFEFCEQHNLYLHADF